MADARWAWRVAAEPAAIAALADEWNALSSPLSAVADATFSRCMAAAFTERGTSPPTIHALYDGDRLAAVLPLRRRYLPWRVWEALQNEHSPYWMIAVAEPTPALARAIVDHLTSDAEYFFFRRFHLETPLCALLLEAARDAGLRTSVIPTEQAGDAYMQLKRPWASFRASLSKNILQDVPRKQRQLEKQGKLAMEMVTDPAVLATELPRCYEIEQRGWKGVTGAPIGSHPTTLRFYNELARELTMRGRFTLCILKLDDRLIAFEYWLRGGGHIDMLKISFDPDYAKYSPGGVLRYLALQREIESGDATEYHLGHPSEWKSRWTENVRTLGSLRCFAPTLPGSAAYLTGPVLRDTVKERFGAVYALWTKLRASREW